MSVQKITKMAQLREALQKGGHVNKHSYGLTGATYYPAKEAGQEFYKDLWPTDVSLVAFNALLDRGELRRLDTPSYRSSDWVLKSTGYTKMEAEAKVNAAKQKLEAANRVLAEAQAARDLAATEWASATSELAKLVEVPSEDL